MRHGLALALLSGTMVWVAPGTIGAQTTFRATAAVSAGASDNPLSAPEGSAAARSDAFFLTQAGFIATTSWARGHQALSYGLTSSLYAVNTQGNAIANRLAWNGAALLSTDARLELEAGLVHERLSSTDPRSATLDPTPGARPSGPAQYVRAFAREGLTWDVTPRWRVSQALGADGFVPLEDRPGLQRGAAATTTLGLSRQWARDSAGVQAQAGYTWSQDVGATPGQPPAASSSGKSLFAQLTALWRRALNVFWSSEVGAGVLVVLPRGGGDAAFGPAGRAALAYTRAGLQAGLEYSHTAQPNVFLGDSLVVDAIALRASHAFGPWERFVLSASGGFQRGRTVTAMMPASVDVWYAVAAASVRPSPTGPLELSLQYQYRDQRGDQSATPGSTTASFRRNMVILTLSASLPNRDGPPPPTATPAATPAR